LNSCKRREESLRKKYMLKKHRKNVLQSKIIEKRVKHDPLQNKGKRII
jgi:hypothetical protein